jgi:CRP/FNR family transcriptional regulator
MNNPLAQNRVFSHLNQHDLQKMTASAQIRRFHDGDWIVHHGDVWPHLLFIQKGEVTAIKESPEGRSLTLATFNAGEIFWGLAFFIENAPMPAALKATEACELLLWSRDDLMPLIMANGPLSWELVRLVIERVQFASEIVEKLAFHPVAGRLARLLLDQTGDSGAIRLPRDLTLDEMAARIGSTREVVSRFLHRFADDGAIIITRTEFSIADQKKLEDLAQKAKG